ncbi:hypothetical protein BDV12DRAFT_164876, partial [Aspergillus spectabilis]
MGMPSATLENLPLELYMQILLNVLDLHSLRSIALSSRFFFQAYLLVRNEALQNVLNTQYDGLVDITEAIAAVRSKRLHASRKEDKESIIALLDARRRSDEIRCIKKQSSATLPLPYRPTDLKELLELLELHQIAVSLLNDFSQNASRPHWIGPATWSSGILPLELSKTEKKRYFRAFYRLQTYGNLFSAGENPVDIPSPGYPRYWDKCFSEDEVWRLFFGPFAPWEVEELGCLWQYFHDRNGERYYEIANDLMQYGRNPVSILPEHLRVLPNGLVLDCDDLVVDDLDIRETLASLGPAFLFKLLQEEDYMTRRNLLLANASRTFLCFPVVSPRGISVKLPLLYPADRFNFGFDVSGFKKFVSTLPDIEQPNAAWRNIWIDYMQEDEMLFEEMFITGHQGPRWRWGYALWDSERLADWGAPLGWSDPGN